MRKTNYTLQYRTFKDFNFIHIQMCMNIYKLGIKTYTVYLLKNDCFFIQTIYLIIYIKKHTYILYCFVMVYTIRQKYH